MAFLAGDWLSRPTPTSIATHACLLLLIAWSVALYFLSTRFAVGSNTLDLPIRSFVAFQIGGGVLYLATLVLLRRKPSTRGWLGAVIAAGLLMRLTQLPATPILEDDYYRYLWDGAVTAHGLSPYAYSPEQIADADDAVPTRVLELAEQSGQVVERINHPWLRTIYPPTAQAAFAMAYWVQPFDIRGLRVAWLALDVAVLWLLISMHAGSARRLLAVGLYWLNPLLIKEVFNAGHMELVLVLTLVLTLALVRRGRHKAGGVMLGLATGAKLWPAIWLPLLLRAAPGSWRKWPAIVAAFALPAGLMALPIVLSRLDASSGFTAYAQRWQMNDSAYLILYETAKLIWADHAQRAARLAVVLILLVVLAYRLRRSAPGFEPLAHSAMVLTAALFLLSPTQFPWYYLWLLPLLTFRPMWSLLALTATLPLYNLRFYLDAIGLAAWHHYGVVWVQFVPIWVALAYETYRSNRRNSPTLHEG